MRASLLETHKMFMEEGKSVSGIANDRLKPIKEATVRSYLAQCFTHGLPFGLGEDGLTPGVVRCREEGDGWVDFERRSSRSSSSREGFAYWREGRDGRAPRDD